MLRTLVDRLATYENVNRARLRLWGLNGAALVNTVFVLDPPLPVEAYVAVVSISTWPSTTRVPLPSQ